MFDFVKDIFRKRSLRRHASTVPTGILPLTKIKSYVAIIDVEDPSFDTCKTTIMNYFRGMDINGAVFFQDFRKIGNEERLITSITTPVLKKDLNWYGKPSREKVALMLSGEPDLFISLLTSTDYPLEFMAKCSRARFKIGRVQLPGDTFDLVIKDPEDRKYSEAEVFKELAKFMEKIR